MRQEVLAFLYGLFYQWCCVTLIEAKVTKPVFLIPEGYILHE